MHDGKRGNGVAEHYAENGQTAQTLAMEEINCHHNYVQKEQHLVKRST